jgi:hypothetical protein
MNKIQELDQILNSIQKIVNQKRDSIIEKMESDIIDSNNHYILEEQTQIQMAKLIANAYKQISDFLSSRNYNDTEYTIIKEKIYSVFGKKQNTEAILQNINIINNEEFIVSFKYETACRNCRHKDNDKSEIQLEIPNFSLKKHTELDIIQSISKRKKGFTCNSCGSMKLEYFDVENNEEMLFNLSKIRKSTDYNGILMMFNVQKNDDKLSFTHTGNEFFFPEEKDYFKQLTIKGIKNISANDFSSHENAHFIIAMTFDFRKEDHYVIETIRHCGFLQQEILEIMDDVYSNLT